MGALALMALLGFGLFAVAIDGSDDAADENEPETPETPETPTDPVDPETPTDPETPVDPETPTDPETPVEGITMTLDGDEVVTGTEGADTLVAVAENREEQALIDETQQIDLSGADDSVTILNDTHLVINAGDGNDLIESLGLGVTINGDAGDDTIYAGSADHAFGGEGDDELIYRGDTVLIDSPAVLEGGAGDDHLVGYVETGAAPTIYDSERGGFFLTGGAGADVYEMKLDVVDYGAEDAPDVVKDTINSFKDFDPDEDSLIVDLSEEDRTLESYEIDKVSYTYGDQTFEYSNLVLTFAATDTQPQVELSVRLDSLDVTLDDITILTAPEPAMAVGM